MDEIKKFYDSNGYFFPLNAIPENMAKNAAARIKNISIKISIESVENIIKNSIDKKKLDKLYASSLEEVKKTLQRN